MPIGLTVIKVNTWKSCFVNNKSMPSQIIKLIPMEIFKQTLGKKIDVYEGIRALT